MSQKKKSPKISLCMIVKDEEDNIGYALDSVKDLVDEMIVVDTGSTDNTVEVCQKYTDKIYHYKWNNDFAAARNESLKYAAGDWIFVLDADEVLYQKDIPKIKAFLKKVPSKIKVVVVYQISTTKSQAIAQDEKCLNNFTNPASRMLRNHETIQFKKSIHELIAVDGENIIKKDFRLFHYGLDIETKERTKRNEKCLEKDNREYGEKDAVVLFNAGKHYASYPDKKKFKDIFDELIEGYIKGTIQRNMELRIIYNFYLRLLIEDKIYDKANQVAYQWLSRLKGYDIRPYFHLAKSYYGLNQLDESKKLFELVKNSLEKGLNCSYEEELPFITWQVYLYLASLYVFTDEREKAKELLEYVKQKYSFDISNVEKMLNKYKDK